MSIENLTMVMKSQNVNIATIRKMELQLQVETIKNSQQVERTAKKHAMMKMNSFASLLTTLRIVVHANFQT